jgi:hypothetical protein
MGNDDFRMVSKSDLTSSIAPFACQATKTIGFSWDHDFGGHVKAAGITCAADIFYLLRMGKRLCYDYIIRIIFIAQRS